MPRAKRKAARSIAVADPQQKAIYAWEREWKDWNIDSLTLAQCRAVIRTACKKFGFEPPTVGQHRTPDWSWYSPTLARIDFLAVRHPWHAGQKNKAVALHEAAHFIHFKLCGWRGQVHGPIWLGIYLWLLVAARVAPRVALYATARAHRLRWSTCKAP